MFSLLLWFSNLFPLLLSPPPSSFTQTPKTRLLTWLFVDVVRKCWHISPFGSIDHIEISSRPEHVLRHRRREFLHEGKGWASSMAWGLCVLPALAHPLPTRRMKKDLFVLTLFDASYCAFLLTSPQTRKNRNLTLSLPQQPPPQT